MGLFWTSAAAKPAEPKLSSDGAPIAPDRTQRARCWESRDLYFSCLDKNAIVDSIRESDKATKACGAQGKAFEANCASSWVRSPLLSCEKKQSWRGEDLGLLAVENTELDWTDDDMRSYWAISLYSEHDTDEVWTV
jgi:hypothetical protein